MLFTYGVLRIAGTGTLLNAAMLKDEGKCTMVARFGTNLFTTTKKRNNKPHKIARIQ